MYILFQSDKVCTTLIIDGTHTRTDTSTYSTPNGLSSKAQNYHQRDVGNILIHHKREPTPSHLLADVGADGPITGNLPSLTGQQEVP